MSNERSGSLDQWRGIAVLAVVFYHANPLTPLFHAHIPMAIASSVQVCVTRLGQLGVDTFFVISGFLITRLLLNEEDQTGSISLAAFYVRRATRILPAMFLYVLTALAASAAGLTRLEPMEGVKAASLLCNTPLMHCAHSFNHFWTLGVEEQFYLLWPLLLVISGRFRVPLVAITMLVGAICAMIPSLIVRGLYYNGLAVYCLSSGVMFALSPEFRAAFAAVKKIPIWALLILLQLFPVYDDGHWNFGYRVAFLIVAPILVSLVLARDGTLFGPRLSEAVRKIGLLSYSIYIWDSFGMWPYVSPAFKAMSVLAMPFAWISYRYVERPFIALGRRWSTAIIETRLEARQLSHACLSKHAAT